MCSRSISVSAILIGATVLLCPSCNMHRSSDETNSHIVSMNRSSDETKSYIFSWRTGLPRTADDWEQTYEITGEEGTSPLDEWISSHQKAIERSKIAPHLSIIPGLELVLLEGDQVYPIYLLGAIPVGRPRQRIEQTWVENIPERDLDQLRSIFQTHGKSTTWRSWEE